MGALGAGAKYGASLPFSREQESEADHIGLLYMARAGYDPKESIAFWQRMEEQTGKGATSEFASSHPSHNTRIARLQQWIPEAQQELDQYRRSQSAPAG